MGPSSREQPANIGFLGFGEAARSFAQSLTARQTRIRLFAWDILLDGSGRSAAMREIMAAHEVEMLSGPDSFGNCDLIFSAVTASQCLGAIGSLAPFVRPGQSIIDINSVAPAIKRQAADTIGTYGAAYLDMAVMAPVHPNGHGTAVCVAGPTVGELWPILEDMGFNGQVVGTEAGAATAIKMVRSLFVKGLEAITVEALLAAEASGCFDIILASLAASYPGLGWPTIASYHLDRVISHGKRRSEEMLMSAETLNALGLNGNLARHIAAVHALTHAATAGGANRSLRGLVSLVLAHRLGDASRQISSPFASGSEPDTTEI